MLCNLCNQFQGRWPIESQIDTDKRRGQGNRSLVVPEFAWAELVDSATKCYGCNILLTGCRGVFEQHDVKEVDIVHGKLWFQYPAYVEDADEADCDKHLTFSLGSGQKFEVELFVTEDNDCPIPDAWDYIPTLGRTSARTDSKEALEIVNNWIEECTSNHHADSFCEFNISRMLFKSVLSWV